MQGGQHKENGSLSPEEIEEFDEFSSCEDSDDDAGGSDSDTSYLGGSSTSDEELFTDGEDLVSSEEELGGDNEADTSANPKGKDAHKSTLISNNIMMGIFTHVQVLSLGKLRLNNMNLLLHLRLSLHLSVQVYVYNFVVLCLDM